jgi:hypothetical protein
MGALPAPGGMGPSPPLLEAEDVRSPASSIRSPPLIDAEPLGPPDAAFDYTVPGTADLFGVKVYRGKRHLRHTGLACGICESKSHDSSFCPDRTKCPLCALPYGGQGHTCHCPDDHETAVPPAAAAAIAARPTTPPRRRSPPPTKHAERQRCHQCDKPGHLAAVCALRPVCRACDAYTYGAGKCRCTAADLEAHDNVFRRAMLGAVSPAIAGMEPLIAANMIATGRAGALRAAAAQPPPAAPAPPPPPPPPPPPKPVPLLKSHFERSAADLILIDDVAPSRWCFRFGKRRFVDRRALHAVTAAVAMMPRTGPGSAATWAVAKSTSAKMHQNLTGIDDADVADSITAAAALGFSRGMATETELMRTMNADVARTARDHDIALAAQRNPQDTIAELVAFQNRVTEAYIKILMCLTVFCILACAWPHLRLLAAFASAGAQFAYTTWDSVYGYAPAEIFRQFREAAHMNCTYAERHWSFATGFHCVTHEPLNLTRAHPEFNTTTNFTLNKLTRAAPISLDHIALAATSSLPVVPHSDGLGEAHGLETRVFGNTVIADPEALSEFSAWLRMFLDLELPLPPCVICHQYDDAPDAHAMCYADWNSTERVRTAVARKHDLALAELDYGLRKPHHRRTGFVKVELTTGKALVGDYDPMDERIIQDVDARVHVTLGPYMYCFSKYMAQVWDRTNWLVYASSVTTEEAAATLDPALAYYVGDLSRYDRSIHRETLAALNDWRAHHIHLSKNARECLSEQLDTRGVTMKGRHEYRVPGQRKSGDDNTSCDNTILNIAAHVWAISHHTGHQLARIRQRSRFMALGDDIVVQGPPEYVNVPFRDILATIGWTAKPKVEYDISRVEFCSRVPWPSTNGLKFATRPGRALSRFPFSAMNPCPVDVGTKAYGLYLDNAHVPFFRRYLERCLALYPVAAATRTAEWTFRPSTDQPIARPTTETWAMLYDLYHLTQQDEDAYAQRLEQWHGGPAFYDDPIVNYLYSVEKIGGDACIL